MFKYNILIFNFWTLLTKSTNQPAPQTNQHHEPTSTRTNQHTNQPAHEPTAKQTQQGTKSSQQGICIGK